MFDRDRTLARFVATTIVSAILSIATSASAQEAHGVIAFGETDQGDGVAYAFAWNFAAKSTAHAEAVNACTSSGGTNCIQLAWFRNGCGALAMDDHGNAQGKSAMSREQAETRALRTCETAGGNSCAIIGSVCAAPGGEPGTWSGGEDVLAEQAMQTTDAAPEQESLTREERIRVQQTLNALGFNAGPADGVFGQRTRSAIRQWQDENGLDATGYLTRELAGFLIAGGESSGGEHAAPTPIETQTDSQTTAWREGVPLCDGMEVGSFCWKEIANKPGCFLMTYDFHETVTWFGRCLDGVAHGRGTLVWRDSKVNVRSLGKLWPSVRPDEADLIRGTGEMVQGKMDGRWVHRFPDSEYADEFEQEVEYAEGRQNGWFIVRSCENGQWMALVSGYSLEGESSVEDPGDEPDWAYQCSMSTN